MSWIRSTSTLGTISGAPPGLPPGSERRMANIQRRACLLAYAAMHRCGIARPDAVFASTALGCLDDTERFLAELNDANGSLLSPLPFMRSTHNTMAAQFALLLRADGPNITYSQGAHGFHAALVGALLYLNEHPDHHVLVLAIEERTTLLDRVAKTLSAEVEVGEGGDAYVLSGVAHNGDIARVEFSDGNHSTGLVVGSGQPVHGALEALAIADHLSTPSAGPVLIDPFEHVGSAIRIEAC